jgi:hypothetical protein
MLVWRLGAWLAAGLHPTLGTEARQLAAVGLLVREGAIPVSPLAVEDKQGLMSHLARGRGLLRPHLPLLVKPNATSKVIHQTQLPFIILVTRSHAAV